MRHPRELPRTLFLLVLALALVAAACGGDGDDEAVDAGDDGGGAAAGACLEGAEDCDDVPGEEAGPPPAGDGAIPVQEEPTLVPADQETIESSPQPWDDVVDDGDGDDTTHLVTFRASPAPCSVVDRVEVTESDTTVTIAVFTGPEVGSEGVACAAVAELKAVPVKLQAPLGERTAVDPARLYPEE